MNEVYSDSYVRPSVPEDVTALAPRLRKADKRELAALGLTPEAALKYGLECGKCLTACLTDGTVIAMFGAGPGPDAGLGFVWLLGSDDLLSVRRTFLAQSKHWLDELFKGFTVLGNIVHTENTVHIRWLKWLGMEFIESPARGKDGSRFLEFWKLRS